jgi:hypothetical protein
MVVGCHWELKEPQRVAAGFGLEVDDLRTNRIPVGAAEN